MFTERLRFFLTFCTQSGNLKKHIIILINCSDQADLMTAQTVFMTGIDRLVLSAVLACSGHIIGFCSFKIDLYVRGIQFDISRQNDIFLDAGSCFIQAMSHIETCRFRQPRLNALLFQGQAVQLTGNKHRPDIKCCPGMGKHRSGSCHEYTSAVLTPVFLPVMRIKSVLHKMNGTAMGTSLHFGFKVLVIGCFVLDLTMFTDVNEKTGTIAQQVGQTPQGWNGSIFAMIQGLSQTVIVPIAGMIITFVLCYELISMVTERNNLHDTDTWMFFKWVFKAFVAVYLVTNTFNITMAIFDVGQRLVSAAAGVIGGNTSLDVASTITTLETSMETMELGELLQLAMETMLVSMCMKIISILITVVLYGRMIEIYLYTSVAPVPFATLTNREWGQVGNNYARGLIALGFQGFFIMVIVGIYCVLVNSMTVAADIHSALFSIAAYTVILCFALFKTGSVSKSIFNAH